jgi:CheY-like chemotaxis protein
LSTVYGIVKQGGGHVEVFSDVGKGTAFKIYFPRVDVEGRVDLPIVQGLRSLVGSETVLVVEDDESVRRIAVRILQDHQYSVLEARAGKDALKLCEHHEGVIDLLLTDLVMPGMGGKELAELVSASRPEIKVAFMSGYAEEGRGTRDVSDKGNVFVQKPLIPGELARKMREALDGN